MKVQISNVLPEIPKLTKEELRTYSCVYFN